MGKNVKLLRVVVASPSDVDEERKWVSDVVEEVNRTVAETRDLYLRAFRWEIDVSPGASEGGAQIRINEKLKIPECDILIGIFWKRFGTETLGFGSGTQYEIETAYNAWRAQNRPHIMLYFCGDSFDPSDENLRQHEKVLEFKRRVREWGIYRDYKKKDFERQLRVDLTEVVKTLADSSADPPEVLHFTKAPLTVVVGDRRERPVETPGDLFAHTSSTRDLTWLFSLGLPKSTVLWNDKVVNATSHEGKIPDYVKDCHLLIVGSAYCNLMARLVNKQCFFPFNIDPRVLQEIDDEEARIHGIHRKEKELTDFLAAMGSEYSERLLMLRGNGFCDVIKGQKHVGAYSGMNDDHATVSFCKHPYSTQHCAILVAGLHLPGTMAAVKQLSDPQFFSGRPLGGILKVIIPEGEWYERLTRATIEWFTPEYTLEKYEGTIKQFRSFGLFDADGAAVHEQSLRNLLQFHRELSVRDVLTRLLAH